MKQINPPAQAMEDQPKPTINRTISMECLGNISIPVMMNPYMEDYLLLSDKQKKELEYLSDCFIRQIWGRIVHSSEE